MDMPDARYDRRFAADAPEQSHTVFVSFSSIDIEVAKSLLNEIESRNVTTFFAPRDISVGENFAQRIVEGIAGSECVVVLLSQTSIESPHVRREVSLAIDERRQLIPITLDGVRFPQDFSAEWSYWLSAVQIYNFDSLEHIADLISRVPERARRTTATTLASAKTPARSSESTSQPPSPVVLLRPERKVVPFVGRQDDLTRLDSWLNRDAGISVRLLTAAAGEGKSRLAQELADRASEHGWVTEFAEDISRPRAIATRPTLLIVDYAETKVAEVTTLLAGLLHAPSLSPIRILLLARSAGDWWRALSSSSAEIEELLADSVVHRLEPLGANVSGSEVYAAAVTAFSQALGKPTPANRDGAIQGESVLEVLQRALLSVLADSDEGDPSRIVARLLGHERRYVRSAAGAELAEFDDADFEGIAVAYSLFPPHDEAEAMSLVLHAQPHASQSEVRRLARLLRRIYPSELDYSSGLKPDAVAELALANYLAENNTIPGGSGLWDAVGISRFEVGLRLLARAAPESAPAANELNRLIPTLDLGRLSAAISIATQIEDPEAIVSAVTSSVETGVFDDHLADVLDLMPDETLGLSDLAATVAARVIAAPHDEPNSGQLLLEASNRFSDAGWADRALSAAQEGITALRSANKPESDAILGIALSNLSNRLWESGSLALSLATAQESLEHVVDQDPVTEVGVRNNAAFRMLELGMYDDARVQLDLISQLRQSADGGSTKARLRFQSALSNRVCLESAVGNWLEAAEIARSVVATRRQDFSAYRDRYTAYLARGLANAALPIAASGNGDEARAMIAEARSLHQLTAARAPIFRFEAAESALIDAIILALDNQRASSISALDAARAELDLARSSVGELGPRLAGAIEKVRVMADSDRPVSTSMLHAVGAKNVAIGLIFPLLLEYKDL